MATDYFTKTGWPSTGASGSSSDARAEIALIETGFSLLPDLTSVANRVVHVNAGSTALITTSGFTFDGTTFTAPAITSSGALSASGALTVTSTSASALAVGANGATNPVLKVNANTASVATGISITGAAAAGGVAVAVISSGTNENLTVDAKGSGTITLGGTSTGAITLTRATTLSAALTYGGVTLSNAVTGTGNMVLSASPTLSGTVGGALTFSGATIFSSTGVAINVTNDVTLGGSLIASGSTHAIGVASTVGWVGLRVNMSLTSNGGSNFALGLDCDPSLTLAAGDISYAAKMGVAGGTITTQGQTETIGHIAALRVGEPNIVVGTGDVVTVAATLYVVDAPTEGQTNAAIYSASGANIFVGNTRIGATTAPTVALDVTGAALISSTLGVTGVLTASATIRLADAQALNFDGSGANYRIYASTAGGYMRIDVAGATLITGTSAAVAITGTLSTTGALTYGGVTLSNAVTGTGNMVLSASPTFTGTVATAALTASGLITANAGVTVASGQTLTLTGATVTGAPTWSSAQQFPSIELGHASDTTLTRVSAGVVAVEGVEVTTLGNTTTGTGSIVRATAPTLSTGANVTMGTGSGTATVVGVANINTTDVGNVGTGEDNLMTYSLPANSLSANGKAVRITAWGTTTNNANSKTLRLYFGTTPVFAPSLTTSIAGRWEFSVVVIRTGSSTQYFAGNFIENNGVFDATTKHLRATSSGTETDSSAIVIKCTGEATSDNDILQKGMLVEFIN